MEAFMTGAEMPYDYQSLISKRNEMRDGKNTQNLSQTSSRRLAR